MSDSVSAKRVALGDDGEIMLDGEQIGYLGWEGNTLIDMIIDKPYRSRGIGTIAIQRMIDQMLESDPSIETITTTSVLSGAMGTALKNVGFDEFVVEKPIMSLDNLPDGVEPDSVPVEESIEYEYDVAKHAE